MIVEVRPVLMDNGKFSEENVYLYLPNEHMEKVNGVALIGMIAGTLGKTVSISEARGDKDG